MIFVFENGYIFSLGWNWPIAFWVIDECCIFRRFVINFVRSPRWQEVIIRGPQEPRHNLILQLTNNHVNIIYRSAIINIESITELAIDLSHLQMYIGIRLMFGLRIIGSKWSTLFSVGSQNYLCNMLLGSKLIKMK